MKRLVRIGENWFEQTGFSLTPVDTPAEIPTDFIDGDKIAAELDGLDFDGMSTKVDEIVATYETARVEAGTGGVAQLTAAREAQAPAVIGHFLREQRKADLGGLGEAPVAVDPNKPAEDPPAEDPPAEDPPAEDPPAEDPEVVIPDDLSGLPAADLIAVSAAAKILAKHKGVDNAAALSSLMPGSAPKGGAQARPMVEATFVAGANKSVQAGANMNDDQIADEMQRWARGVKGGRSAASEIIGRYMAYGDAPSMVASGAPVDGTIKAEAATDFHARRANFKKQNGAPEGVTAAAPDRCGPTDVRRDIPDCGDMSSPLLNSLQSYPAPHCELEYYRDIAIASVSDGITTWDSAARTAYQDALDAWRADIADGSPFSAQLYANLKAAEKQCAIAGCAPSDTVTMLPIAACLEYPTDLEYCSPESIRAYRRALQRLFIRERTSNMLAVVEAFSATVTVDAAAAPFINAETDPVQLGAAAVIDYVVSTLKPQGVMAERVTQGNYSLIVPFGLQMALEMDNRLAWGMETLSDAFGGANVITTLDTATGTALPFGAVPAAASTTAFSALRAPTDWDLQLLDLDDFFEISRPDIELGAQITPESIRGNMVFGGFMESHAGYGKDGCHPSWVISLSNLVYNGARPDRMGLAGLLE